MPHFSIEYSGNLETKVDVPELCELVTRTILDTGLFEVGAVRVRAFKADAWHVADGLAENAFLDMSFRIGEGRSAADKKRAGEAIFAAVSERVAHLLATQHFALSLEIREIDRELSWRKNTLHRRLRDK